ncbi:MAG: hypothetical protein J6C90_00740, partial [Clostridia bacterium]|nr:hypothetical protein [Clostridia bacterium]
NVYCKENIAYPIRAGEEKLFEINYKYHEKAKSSDNEVGTLEVYFKKHLIKTAKLYTINSIDILQEKDILNSITKDWVA